MRTKASENFYWDEFQCKCGCGTAYVQPEAIEKLQLMRKAIGRPFTINSAARCPLHNVRVGGAPLSQHRSTEERPSTAFDISLTGHSKAQLIEAAEAVGFTGIGTSYRTFVHVDNRNGRARW